MKKKLDGNYNCNFRYIRSSIICEIITNCRKTENTVEFKTELGFNLIDLIMFKEESVAQMIMQLFLGVTNDRTVSSFGL